MWIKASGKLTDNLTQLTTSVSSHLLITGDVSALVDGSVAAVAGQLADELDRSLAGSELGFFLLTHTHFDHLGAIPQLRRLFPQAQLIASPRASEILAQPESLKLLFERNQQVSAAMKQTFDLSFEDWCAALSVDRVVNDGDVVDLGGDIDVKVVALPGHTDDLLGYYVPADGAIAAAEAFGGYHGRDKYTPCFMHSLDSYLESIDKVSDLELRVISLPHGGALSGELARKFVTESRLEAERFKTQILERLEQGQLVNEIAAALAPEWRLLSYSPDGPFNVSLEEAVSKMVYNVAEDR